MQSFTSTFKPFSFKEHKNRKVSDSGKMSETEAAGNTNSANE